MVGSELCTRKVSWPVIDIYLQSLLGYLSVCTYVRMYIHVCMFVRMYVCIEVHSRFVIKNLIVLIQSDENLLKSGLDIACS